MRAQYSYRRCRPTTSQRLIQPIVAEVADYPTLTGKLRMGRIAHTRAASLGSSRVAEPAARCSVGAENAIRVCPYRSHRRHRARNRANRDHEHAHGGEHNGIAWRLLVEQWFDPARCDEGEHEADGNASSGEA